MSSRKRTRTDAFPKKAVKNALVARRNAPMPSLRPFRGSSTKTGFPKVLRITHRYCVSKSLSPGGALPSVAISCNGLYDPEGSIFGHQPLYFDQVSPLYHQYCVIGAKIKCTFSTIGGSNVGTTGLGYIHATGTPSSANFLALCERPTAKTVVVPANGGKGSVTMKWSAKKNFGTNPMDDDEFQGTASANPVEMQWAIFTAGPAGETNDSQVDAFIEAEYLAVWNELKDVAMS